MRQSFLTVSATAGVLLAASAVQAQHSYLPAQDSSGRIHTFTDSGVGSGFTQDRVVFNEFNSSNTVGLIDPAAARAGAPSAFSKDNTDDVFNVPADHPSMVGFTALPGNTDLGITNPVLSNPAFSASGNFLYWDGVGTPDFGAAPLDVTILIGREESDTLTPKGVLDGGMNTVAWIEDTTNATGGRSGHFHLRYDVVGENGGGFFEAPDGVYLLGHIVGLPGLTDSETVYVPLLKNKADDLGLSAGFISAISFVESNVVPEPATGLVFTLGGGLMLLGSRRKASS